MKRIYVPFPNLDIQSRIADFLDDKCGKIDRYIEKQQQIIEKLKAYKQAVITEAVTKGLDPDVPMKDSGIEWIGEIPEHWNVGQLKYFVKIRSGITLGKKYAHDIKLKEYPYLRVANVQGEYTELSDVSMISVPEEEAQKYFLRTGELLMTEGGDRDKLGRGCVWKGEIVPCLHQNHIFAVTTNELRLNVYYLDYVTTSNVGRSYFDYRLEKEFDGSISLEGSEGGLGSIKGEAGAKVKKSNALTEIIASINEKYGTEFTEMDKVLEQIQNDFLADDTLVRFAQNNDETMFGLKFEQEFENIAAQRYEQNDAFFIRMFQDSDVMKSVVEMLKPIIYRKMRRKK